MFRQLARSTALSLDLWPAPRDLLREETGKRRLRRQRLDAARRLNASDEGHQWRWIGGRFWACANCYKRTSDTRGVRGTGPCSTTPPAINAAITQGEKQGHSVHVAIVLHDEHPLYFCTRCGAYGEYAPRKLAEPCRRTPNRGAQDKLRRIAKHEHPHTKAQLGPIWRVTHVARADPPAQGHGTAKCGIAAISPWPAAGSLVAADAYDEGFGEWVRQQAEEDPPQAAPPDTDDRHGDFCGYGPSGLSCAQASSSC